MHSGHDAEGRIYFQTSKCTCNVDGCITSRTKHRMDDMEDSRDVTCSITDLLCVIVCEGIP